MTVVDTLEQPQQRLVLNDVDWSLYEHLLESLDNRHVFVTYYKGTMEVMTPSFQHDRSGHLLGIMIHTMAQETDTPIASAGSTTLKRGDIKVAVEADECFYLGDHAHQMSVAGKRDIVLPEDPPPDLAVEVEVSRRLGERIDIYRELGVPELWRYGKDELHIYSLRSGGYERVERSSYFPQLSPEELAQFVEDGLSHEETGWIKRFRQRVREAIGEV